MPTPMSPSWNTSTPNTGINASTPAASPNPPFTEMSENTRPIAPRVVHDFDGRRHHLGMFVVRPRVRSENGRRIPANNSADSRNDTALTMKATSRPKTVETTPPTAAPTASIVPHSEPLNAFAVGRSSGSTRFGIAADEAGSNGALKTDSTASSGYANQTVSGPTSRNAAQMATRARSQPDHQLAAVEPVGQHAGERRRQEEGRLLSEDGQADVDRAVGGLEDQPGDRDEQEPVAAERDHRRQEQPSEVAVPPEQREAGAKAGGRYSSSSHWLNVAGRFSRNAPAPSIASWWKSLMAVRAAMSSPAWSKVRCAAL